MEKKRRFFPDGVKRQAVERVETSGVSIVDVAAELGVHGTQLRRWTRQSGQAGTGPAQRPIRQAQGPSPADLAAENDEPWARRRQRCSDRRPPGSNRWRHGGQLSNAWRRDGSLQHSDRGVQYAVDDYRQALAAAKITPSMSRNGNRLEFKPVRASGSNGPGAI